MGDRGNIRFDFGEHGSVYLYGHWSGHDLWETLRDTLRRHVRWDDDQYLCRMVFDAMVGGNQGGDTGFGVSPMLCDNEHPILAVFCGKQRVLVEPAPGRDASRLPERRDYSFDEFCALESDPRRLSEVPR